MRNAKAPCHAGPKRASEAHVPIPNVVSETSGKPALAACSLQPPAAAGLLPLMFPPLRALAFLCRQHLCFASCFFLLAFCLLPLAVCSCSYCLLLLVLLLASCSCSFFLSPLFSCTLLFSCVSFFLLPLAPSCLLPSRSCGLLCFFARLLLLLLLFLPLLLVVSSLTRFPLLSAGGGLV